MRKDCPLLGTGFLRTAVMTDSSPLEKNRGYKMCDTCKQLVRDDESNKYILSLNLLLSPLD